MKRLKMITSLPRFVKANYKVVLYVGHQLREVVFAFVSFCTVIGCDISTFLTEKLMGQHRQVQ